MIPHETLFYLRITFRHGRKVMRNLDKTFELHKLFDFAFVVAQNYERLKGSSIRKHNIEIHENLIKHQRKQIEMIFSEIYVKI